MASHRKPRPGGTPGTGIRTPALATAALTSVAVLSQSAEATPMAAHGKPSLEEVERKIDDLYRRAESTAETSGASFASLMSGTGRDRAEWAQEAERARQAERADRARQAERAEDSRRRADSLQRLRDEVARRAQGRGLPAQRGAVPAQRGSTPAPDTTPTAPVRDTRGTPPSVPSTPSTPSVRDAAPASPVRDQDIPPYVRDTGMTQPGRDQAATPSVPGARTASPLRDTPGAVPVRDMGDAPAASGTAAVTSAGSPREAAASGPKAAKAAVQKKLAHARVLLAQQTAQGAATPSGTYASKARKAIAFARAQLGKPCLAGTAGPGSYDCSGLTQAAWKSAGVTLPRTAREQADAGTPVPPDEARPGDLVFFRDDVSHVGLCTGDGMMIHAPRPGAYVREEPVSGVGGAAVHSVVRPG
ncbi:NlpC/P60 family protein [Streptomyces sp. NPDC046727]|uniref:C40 family peptidase n=1 Tax=Streptomyces sp. NPDC046727 TaxID=3155373 RepID=UPI0034032299